MGFRDDIKTAQHGIHKYRNSRTHAPLDWAYVYIEKLLKESLKPTIKTNKGYRAEWKYCSKARMVKYYAIHVCIAILVSVVTGVVVGLCLRYVDKEVY